MTPSGPLLEFAFHDIKTDYPDQLIQKPLKSGQITKLDGDLIREYVADTQTVQNVGEK